MFKIGIIGAGPAGLSAASRLLKCRFPGMKVNLFDRSLIPYGLLRTGVAPDHPEVKHTAQAWSNVKDFQNFKFFGGVNVSDCISGGTKSDISLAELLEAHDTVFLCNGAYHARSLQIPGSDSIRVINAQSLVGYYNGDIMQPWNLDPRYLEGHVGIIGGGNVALDVARVLLEPGLLRFTDASQKFLDQAENVEKVSIFIRRGPFDLPCTTRELRELIHLPSVSNVIVNGLDKPLSESAEYKALQKSRSVHTRKTKRLLKLLADSETSNGSSFSKGKTVVFNFFHTPYSVQENTNSIDVTFTHKGQNRTSNLSALVESLGYEKTPISSFIQNVDPKYGRAHAFGRRIYMSGWALNGAKGVVGDSTESSRIAVESFLQDIESEIVTSDDKRVMENLSHTTWKEWEQIDQHELYEGLKINKARQKILSLPEMLQISKHDIL